MQDLVILMRAVNVGGRRMPMADLRALCAAQGLADPETYIQSGNLIVGSEDTSAKLRETLEKSIAAEFGFEVPLVVRTAEQWKVYLTGNPFKADKGVENKMLHLVLAETRPPKGTPDMLAEMAQDGERIRLAGDALWIDFGKGVGNSKLTPKLIDKAFGAPATARNLNTVIKLQDMLEARA